MSRREPLDEPASVATPGVAQTVVQAVGAALPEFERVGDEAIAAPVGRPGDGLVGMAAFGFAVLRFEDVAARDHLALGRGPGADAGAPGPALEIAVGFLGGDAFDSSFDAHLALELVPEEDEGGVGVGLELAGLAALVVGEEREAPLVGAAKQDHPRGGAALRRGRRERHRVRFGVSRIVAPPRTRARTGGSDRDPDLLHTETNACGLYAGCECSLTFPRIDDRRRAGEPCYRRV